MNDSTTDFARRVSPPALVRWLLERALSSSTREFILGDLEERFHERAQTDGNRSARTWYMLQALRSFIQTKPPKNDFRGHPRKGGDMFEGFWQDLRFGLRMLRKNWGFSAAAVLTLALGIGANTAIFSIVYGVLLKPVPFSEPDRLVTLWHHDTRQGVERDDVSPPNFLDWQEQSTSFEAIAAVNPWTHDTVTTGEPETFRSALVTARFFELLGVQPLMGRTFREDEFTAGRDRVVILPYGTWKDRFGGDPGILGKTILLDNEAYLVVGVLPSEFRLRLFGPSERDLYAPQVWEPEVLRTHRAATYLKVLARLKPGISLEQARVEMAAIAKRLEQQHPHENNGVTVTVLPYHEHLVSDVRVGLLLLLGAVGFVLLIACANVANLMLVRGSERKRELAVRTALGAGRGRLARQLLTESLLLAIFGAALGVVIAGWSIQGIVHFSPANLVRIDEISLNATVLGFAGGITLLTALVFGLAPALQLARPGIRSHLREGDLASGTGAPQQRLRGVLVIAEVALALVLLIGAGLLIQSFASLIRVHPGFDPDRILSLQVFLWNRYEGPEQRIAFVRDATARFEALPGVEAAGATSALPFLPSSQTVMIGITVEGRPAPPPGQERTAQATIATPQYFRSMGISLLKGRLYDERDTSEQPRVVLINQTLARQFFEGRNPVGSRIAIQSRKPAMLEVIGVVADAHQSRLDQPAKPEFYLPHTQSATGSMIFVLRTQSPAALAESARAALWEIDKSLPIYYLATLDELLGRSLAQRRFTLLLLAMFAGLALVLAAIGLYGVSSYATAQRTREIGIRLALGAKPGHVLRMVLVQGMRLVGLGVAAGIALALGLTRFLDSMLYSVRAADPILYAGVAATLVGIATLACWLPARRATRVDPAVALHYE